MDRLGNKASIGVGAKFSGTLSGVRAIEINGNVIADLAADKVTIGESGIFEGAINADLIVVSGEYDGVMVAGSVWATSTARISGKVQYKTLQMDRGAALNCHVIHNWVSKPEVLDVGKADYDAAVGDTNQSLGGDSSETNETVDIVNKKEDVGSGKSVNKRKKA